ncbi:MAG: ATPase, T2SS/T4P/T4SS family [Dehalococcoidia bacterium]
MPRQVLAPQQKKLGEMLIEAGLLSRQELEPAIAEARKRQVRLGDYLVEEGLVQAADVAGTLSRQLGLPIVDLKSHRIQPEALLLVPEGYARQNDLIPVELKDGRLVVAMADPGNIQVLEDLENRARMDIQATVGIPSDIRGAINRSYRASGAIEEQISRVVPAQAQPEDEAPGGDMVAQNPIVRTVELLLEQAVRDRASDIHLEPQEAGLRVRYRIDGILHDAETLPLGVTRPLLSRLKVLAGMNIAERRRPQDGQFSVQVESKDVDFRAATSDSVHGEMMVLRVLDKALSLFDLTDLGFSPESLALYTRMLRAPFGMILVGGPTGSGKTTTLYASVNQLDRRTRNVVTIEDPIEYIFEDITQIQVNPRADITFASGLRSIMRLDPDVILVGEVRDGEAASMATQAALTGHLVLSSIHANDAVGVLFRLVDLGVEPYLISSALVGMVSQRMVRRICQHCRQLARVPAEGQLVYQEELGERPDQLYYGAGCNICAGTGYLGRTGVFEVMAPSEELRRLYLRGETSGTLRGRAIAEGMITMRRDGMLKVQQGITTPDEVIRNIFSIT